ncbi:hypothetical protein [Antarcticimicrobium luteum]|uniref:hypothetical protein n=1 Tax=Antarcticimicrobium luteum TaxID=2547397 RepID=UPI0014086D95|nr:hypothetical protein [Antarcticimicrobium luteum]
MTGLRVSLLGAIALTALFAGAVALYASDAGQKNEARFSAAPYHVQKAMTLTIQ